MLSLSHLHSLAFEFVRQGVGCEVARLVLVPVRVVGVIDYECLGGDGRGGGRFGARRGTTGPTGRGAD